MSRETVVRTSCHACGGNVAVKKNVSDKAYYSCDHCGFKGQHTWQKSSDAFLARLAPKPAPAPIAATPAAPPQLHLVKPAPAGRPNAGTVLG